MTARLRAGVDISPGTVTAELLHKLIEGKNSPSDKTVLLLTKLGKEEMASGAGLVIASASAPADTKHIWYDTNLLLARVYDGTNWEPIPPKGTVLTNASGAAVAKGDIVIFSTGTDSAFTTTTSAGNVRVIGVAAESIANGAKGVIRTHGIHPVNFQSTPTVLQFVSTSTSAKLARSSATRSGADLGMVIQASISGASLVTCFLYGRAVYN